MANDWSLSLAYRVIRAFAPPAAVEQLTLAFAHPNPRDQEPYLRVFGGPVRFGRARNAIGFPRAWLDLPQPHGDAATCAGLRELAERMLADVQSQRRPVRSTARHAARRAAAVPHRRGRAGAPRGDLPERAAPAPGRGGGIALAADG
jgi:hypothetical protein